jgi:D-sedoheptulose 7-phosphate isomerase
MKDCKKRVLEELGVRYPMLLGQIGDINNAFDVLDECYKKDGRVYICGNGGSASDSEHIAGELLKCFKKKRALPVEFAESLKEYGEEGALLLQDLEGGLPAIPLCGFPGFTTAFANDKNPTLVFAQLINSLGRAGDVLITLSTSGNSKNCVFATIAAKAKGMKVVFLGGGNGGKLKELADVSVVVPEKETYKVQELHLPVYHCLCAMLEEEYF